MNQGWAIVAFVSSEEELPRLIGNFITLDYNENYEYFLKIEKILMDQRNEGRVVPATIFCDPKEDEFWVPAKVYHNNKVRFHTTKVRKNYKLFKQDSVVFVQENSDFKMLEGVSLVLRKQGSEFWDCRAGKSITALQICELLSTRNI
jgi:hypothetical protein